MPATLPAEAEIDAILVKLGAGEPLTVADGATIKVLVHSLAMSVAALDEANAGLQLHLKIATEAQSAAEAAQDGVLNGLQMLAPPAATVDIDQAMTQILELRKKIETNNNLAQLIATTSKFAISFASKFI